MAYRTDYEEVIIRRYIEFLKDRNVDLKQHYNGLVVYCYKKGYSFVGIHRAFNETTDSIRMRIRYFDETYLNIPSYTDKIDAAMAIFMRYDFLETNETQ